MKKLKHNIVKSDSKSINFENDILIERLNAACKLIYLKYNTDQYKKVDRTIVTSYKFKVI
jgi:hypothetical protein